MRVGVPDTTLKDWLKGDEMIATDEGEAVAIATGYYLATGKPATVFMGADGFCNALNPFTSLVLPYEIEMNWVIGAGRQEPQHKVMSNTIEKLLKVYDKGRCHFTIIR